MKVLNSVVKNVFLFAFLTVIFNGIQTDRFGVLGFLIMAIIFGLIMSIVPTALGFFKIPVNVGSTLLLSIVFSFIYFFALDNGLFSLTRINDTTIRWGLSGIPTTRLDETTSIVLVSVVASLLSVWLSNMSKK